VWKWQPGGQRIARGQHQHRHRAVGAFTQLRAHRQAVQSGQAQVQQQHVGRLVQRHLQCQAAVAGFLHAPAGSREHGHDLRAQRSVCARSAAWSSTTRIRRAGAVVKASVRGACSGGSARLKDGCWGVAV
jgi:hypothetical protein